MSALVPWLILLPFAGAILSFVLPRRFASGIGLAVGLLNAATCAGLVRDLRREGALAYAIGGWPAPLGIGLRVDGLAAVHLVMTAVVGLGVSFYARAYFAGDGHAKEGRRLAAKFWPLWLFLWGALNALYLSGDIFNLYVLLELLGLSAVGLVALTGTARVTAAALRYLLAAIAGSMTYLLGVAFLYAAHGTLDVRALGALVQPNAVSATAMALIVLGLLVKTALFPLHFWLPPAHAGATAPVSAILSALVVKASFYIVLRLWIDVFPGAVTYGAGQFLGCLGACAVLWGSVQALRQTRLKLMVAHSTVAQLGYLFLFFPITAAAPLLAEGAPPWVLEAGKGVVYHGLSHALAKASLFLSAGILVHAAGSDALDRMRGMAERLPVTVFAMALAGVSLMGLPPSGGFIAKWLILHAALSAGQWWWVPVIILGGLLTAGYIFAMLRTAFLPGGGAVPLGRAPMALQGVALALALIGIAIGLRAGDVMELLTVGSPFGPGVAP